MMTSPSRTTPACRTGSPSPSATTSSVGRGSGATVVVGRVVGTAVGRHAEGEQPRSDDGAHDEAGDEADPPGEGAHGGRRRHRYASSKTSTGVPCSAKPKSICGVVVVHAHATMRCRVRRDHRVLVEGDAAREVARPRQPDLERHRPRVPLLAINAERPGRCPPTRLPTRCERRARRGCPRSGARAGGEAAPRSGGRASATGARVVLPARADRGSRRRGRRRAEGSPTSRIPAPPSRSACRAFRSAPREP